MITPAKIKIAAKYLENAETIAKAADTVGLPFAVACALIEKESGGRNVYGRDVGGALSGFPGPVNKSTYAVFRWLVFTKGMSSNGCGPCQITFRGYFPMMEKRGLKPWKPLDSMTFGFEILRDLHKKTGSWAEAGARYNGSLDYGADLARRIDVWKGRFK